MRKSLHDDGLFDEDFTSSSRRQRRTKGKSANKERARTEQEENQHYANQNFKLKSFVPLNRKQSDLYKASLSNPLVIAYGPAGTAKSFVAAAAAIRSIVRGSVEKIIITRNPVPTGFTTGLKPGSTEEKMAPWVAPILDNLKEICRSENGNDGYFNYLLRTNKIEVKELESIKGSNLRDAFVILEEGQECSLEQLKNLATRASGDNTVVFINGDTAQGNSRLKGAKDFMNFITGVSKMNRDLDSGRIPASESDTWVDLRVPIVEFDKNDCVRSGITRWMLEMFEREEL